MPSPKMMLAIAVIALLAVAVANRIPAAKSLLSGNATV